MRGEKKERKMGKKMRETLSKDKVKRIFCKGERERDNLKKRTFESLIKKK